MSTNKESTRNESVCVESGESNESETSSPGTSNKVIPMKPLAHTQVRKNGQYALVTYNRQKKMEMLASGEIVAEIKRLQNSTKFAIPRFSFARLVKEITRKYGDYKFEALALQAIQETTELFLIGLMSDSYQLTRHRNRETLGAEDIQLLVNLLLDLVPSLQPILNDA